MFVSAFVCEWVSECACVVCRVRACACVLSSAAQPDASVAEVHAGSRSRTSRLLLALGALNVGVIAIAGQIHIHGSLIARRAVQLHGAELLRRTQSGREDTLAVASGATFRRRMAAGKTCEEMRVV